MVIFVRKNLKKPLEIYELQNFRKLIENKGKETATGRRIKTPIDKHSSKLTDHTRKNKRPKYTKYIWNLLYILYIYIYIYIYIYYVSYITFYICIMYYNVLNNIIVNVILMFLKGLIIRKNKTNSFFERFVTGGSCDIRSKL